jgi:hypothetical protein
MQSCDIEIYSTPLVRGSPKPNKREKNEESEANNMEKFFLLHNLQKNHLKFFRDVGSF